MVGQICSRAVIKRRWQLLEDSNTVLRTDIVELYAKSDSESLELHREFQKVKGNTVLQTNAAARL